MLISNSIRRCCLEIPQVLKLRVKVSMQKSTNLFQKLLKELVIERGKVLLKIFLLVSKSVLYLEKLKPQVFLF